MECLICKNKEEKKALCEVRLLEKPVHRLVSCPSCGASFFDPPPSLSELSGFYGNAYYAFDKYKDEYSGSLLGKKLRRLSKAGNFLDIGCSTGHFLKGVRDSSGWECFGTEFSENAASYAKEKLGLDVRPGDIKTAGFPENCFNYIQMNNVLEHVTDPAAFLTEIYRILKPAGTFQLMIPNGKLDILLLKRFYEEEKSPPISKDGHIFFFPAKTLMALLTNTGFKISRARTCSIARGLKVSGILPLNKEWKESYRPAKKQENQEFKPVEKKRHSNFYYSYRHFMNNAKNIPGMYSFGLDYLVFATKTK